MTEYTGRSKYMLGEFGVGFTLLVGLLATYFWMRRREVRPGGVQLGGIQLVSERSR